MQQLMGQVLKAGLVLTSLAFYTPIMEPANPSPFSNLPIEIALIVFTYAAKPTFSQEEKYDDKNPYSTAVSLCLVSQLVRRTILPEFLHTILLRRPNSVNMFENALRMQKAYAEKESDLVFDYISAIKRMWIDDLCNYPVDVQSQTM